MQTRLDGSTPSITPANSTALESAVERYLLSGALCEWLMSHKYISPEMDRMHDACMFMGMEALVTLRRHPLTHDAVASFVTHLAGEPLPEVSVRLADQIIDAAGSV